MFIKNFNGNNLKCPTTKRIGEISMVQLEHNAVTKKLYLEENSFQEKMFSIYFYILKGAAKQYMQ